MLTVEDLRKWREGMKRKTSILLFLLVLMMFLIGCGSKKEESQYKVYYLNADGTGIVDEDIELHEIGTKGKINEFLTALSTQPGNSSMRRTIPTEIKVNHVETESYQLMIDFSKEYLNLTPIDEVLIRAAITKTLLQIEDYSYVSFTVENQPLVNHNGVVIGSMSEDTFVENPGQQISSSQKTTMTLYFSNKEGNALVKESRVVHYSSHISLEKLVMEQLMEGPKKAGS